MTETSTDLPTVATGVGGGSRIPLRRLGRGGDEVLLDAGHGVSGEVEDGLAPKLKGDKDV